MTDLTADYCLSESERQDRLAIEAKRLRDFRKAEQHEMRACWLREFLKRSQPEAHTTSKP